MAAPLEAESHRIAHAARETGSAVRMARTTKPTSRLQLTPRVYRDPVLEHRLWVGATSRAFAASSSTLSHVAKLRRQSRPGPALAVCGVTSLRCLNSNSGRLKSSNPQDSSVSPASTFRWVSCGAVRSQRDGRGGPIVDVSFRKAVGRGEFKAEGCDDGDA